MVPFDSQILIALGDCIAKFALLESRLLIPLIDALADRENVPVLEFRLLVVVAFDVRIT